MGLICEDFPSVGVQLEVSFRVYARPAGWPSCPKERKLRASRPLSAGSRSVPLRSPSLGKRLILSSLSGYVDPYLVTPRSQ